MPKKLTKEIVNERIADRGIKLIGEYENANTKTTFQCPEDHTWDATPDSVMSGSGCPHCGGLLPLTKEIVNERIAERGIKLIGEYENARTKTTFQCAEGHTWGSRPNDILNGNGCPHCNRDSMTLTKPTDCFRPIRDLCYSHSCFSKQHIRDLERLFQVMKICEKAVK